jgi:hypothetical protein
VPPSPTIPLAVAGSLISRDIVGTAALPLSIDFSRQPGKKIVGGGAEAMSDINETTEQVDGYQVPVDPMDDTQCDSCQ